MHYGFVTGLPRSGSAWLANYLSYGNCMFLHDAWAGITLDDFKSESEGMYAAGTCDPANVLQLDKLDKYFPEAKWVVVTRSANDVKAACDTIKFPFVDFTDKLKVLMDSRKVLKVPFRQMFKRADEIGRFIYPDWECPKWRHDQLVKLNVQLHWGKVSEQFTVPENLPDMPVMTPAKMEFLKLLKQACKEDVNSIRFLAQAREASDLYRGLSESSPVNKGRAIQAMEDIAVEWMVNPFIRTYYASLAPAISVCLEKYHNSTPEECPIDVDLVNVVLFIHGTQKEYMPKIRELSKRILEEKKRTNR